MPKQGQFAKSSRIKQIKHRQRQKGKKQGREIDQKMVADFLLVRFALTTKKRLPKVAQETNQRFLQELISHLTATNGDLTKMVTLTLEKVRGRVPWQFYWQISENWADLQHFLVREVPAVPVTPRLRTQNELAKADFDHLIVLELARTGAQATTLNGAGKASQVEEKLATALVDHDGVKWRQVEALLGPLTKVGEPDVDEGTAAWLATLSQQSTH